MISVVWSLLGTGAQVVTKRQIGNCLIMIVVCPWSHDFSAFFKICCKFSHKACKKVFGNISSLTLFGFTILDHMIFLHFLRIIWNFIGAINNTKQCQTIIITPANSYHQKMLPSPIVTQHDSQNGGPRDTQVPHFHWAMSYRLGVN